MEEAVSFTVEEISLSNQIIEGNEASYLSVKPEKRRTEQCTEIEEVEMAEEG